MRIIHIVDRFDKINFGIWNAAIFGSDYLLSTYGIESVLWHPISDFKYPLNIATYSTDFAKISIDLLITEHQLQPSTDIIVTHGCWQFPTRLGRALQKKGFRWIYVPHGMLEPWSMQHKRWKKWLYFKLVENRLSKQANVVRAVGAAEQQNLYKVFGKSVVLVENGVKIPATVPQKQIAPIRFLFMARLHFKKGIVPLVQAWHQVMKDQQHLQLVIAGPDEGELTAIQPFFTDNIQYVGAVYGEEKKQLLATSHYYVLPSLSEGFPVSVLEAMSYGCIPIITEGCNFSTVFHQKLGYQIESNVASIATIFQNILHKDFDADLSNRNASFIAEKYSEAFIGEQLYNLYSKL